MKSRKPDGYWTYDVCKLEAKKYLTKKEFRIFSGSAYTISIRNGWVDNICIHMKPIGDKYNRCVYVYEFSDNCAYIGLTYNLKRRINDRNKCKSDSVTKHIDNTGLTPKLIQLTDYIFIVNAIKLEEYYLNEYKRNGWKTLNKTKTGSIGSTRKWTKEKCIIESKKYNNRTDFRKKSSGAWEAAKRYGWLNYIYSNILHSKIKRNYWTKERCKEEFLKHKTKGEIKINSNTAYCTAHKNNWLDELSVHMVGRKKNGFWTKEVCINEAKKYKIYSEFILKSKTTYVVASRNGWLNDIKKYF